MISTPRERLRLALETANHRIQRQLSKSAKPRAVVGAEDEQPLRAELFSIRQLEQHARSLAGWHEIEPRKRGRRQDRLLRRLAENEEVLRETHELVTDAVRRRQRITPAAEWFLDNYHLIEEQIRAARRHLPQGYSRELPLLKSQRTPGYPRVYDIALELISHADGRIDTESLRAFVAAYQSVKPLRLGELWAIPIMLQLALLENMRRVAARIAAGRIEREQAGYWFEHILEYATRDPARVVLALADMVKANPPLTNAFVSEFASRLHGQGPALIFPMTWLEQRLAEQNQTIDNIFQQSSQNQAADQVSIGNSIGSLRFLGATEWRGFVESMSIVERTLSADPAGVYPAMDFNTRDRYRHAVEEIAKLSPFSEEDVARIAVESAGTAQDARSTGANGQDVGAQNHVGYYLVGRGRRTFDRRARVRPTVKMVVYRIAGAIPLSLYAGTILVLTALIVALVAWSGARRGNGSWELVISSVLLAIAGSQCAISLVHWGATLLARPRILPRMDFSGGVPEGHRTVVAVPAMLTDDRETDELLDAMEVRFLANRDENILFALLTDFPDASEEKLPDDEARLLHARERINALNQKYSGFNGNGNGDLTSHSDTEVDAERQELGNDGIPGAFYLFHRPRRWNARENVWMGWERKRGKLEELNLALRGDTRGFATIIGPRDRLTDVKYVLTLDSDTQLPREAARLLIGTMAHPLNRPHYDAKRGRVTDGYGILQPRVGISMPSARRSRFAQLFAGEPGIDPYTQAVSDVYQDLFEEGSFIGKGIYDIDTVQKSMGGKLPENRILSHDLLEGAHARSGLVSDVVLFEDFPAAYPADISRRHRWIRGDWQISSWLLPWVPSAETGPARNPISALSLWKIFDNLRRSLVPIAMLGLLLFGWFVATGALLYTLVVVAIVFLPALLAVVTEVLARPTDLPLTQHLHFVSGTFFRNALRDLFNLATLPYDAYFSVEAIVRTLVRINTGCKLLEWCTASDAQRKAHADLAAFYRVMWVSPVLALCVALWLGIARDGTFIVGAPFAFLWLISPAVAWWLSKPIIPPQLPLTEEDLLFLRIAARRTWRFFETFVGPTDNYLPPDNFQEDPPRGAAHRTSPTNIGLSLLANLGAYDFGYISAGEVMARTKRTFETMEKLRRYRGHLFNWYDTRTLEALHPLYVSTVDSGNLAGHLLALMLGLNELADQKIIQPAVVSGLSATLNAVPRTAASPELRNKLARIQDLLRDTPPTLSSMRMLLQRLTVAAADAVVGFESWTDPELKWWVGSFEAQCRFALAELNHLAPWVELPPAPLDLARQGSDHRGEALNELGKLLRHLDDVPTLRDTARLGQTLLPTIQVILDGPSAGNGHAIEPSTAEWLAALKTAIESASERAAHRLSELHELAARCAEFADLDYGFLYDAERQLMAIGYNVGEHRRDASYYDLLASEARFTSFIAIAQGKLPQEHWFRLGRMLTNAGGRPALLSWSGSMFEYLMPLLVMPTHERTLLDESYRAVVARQIEYGRERGVPWGVSESGYYEFDAQLNYQYFAFGVPGLGFKRGLAEDLVIAPYASAMALMIDPKSSCANLRRLARESKEGAYGFYEAVDYTPSRLPRGEDNITVRSFMAHHQGMAFLSLAYVLLDRPMQRRFATEPAFRATDLLLEERVPNAPAVYPHSAEVSAARGAPVRGEANFRVFKTPNTLAPEVHLLSNGRYHVALTAAGGGYSRWRDLAVTRWQEDPTCDAWGSFCYLRDVKTGEFWSVAHQPTLKRAARYETIYSQGRAEFRRRDDDIDTHTEISVSPEDDIELRRVSITNRGNVARTIELTTFAEVVLAPPAADSAHPAFSKLFVQTELVRDRQAILCTRRPRSASERPPWMMHLMMVHGKAVAPASYETDRAQFIGRGRSVVDPAAMHREALNDSEGSVLDPAVAIRNTLVIGPNETARVHIVTGVAETREGVLAMVEKYHDRHLADRVFELAWTQSQVVLRQIDATEAETQLYSRLAGSILYANALLRAPGSVIARNRRGQSGLWGYGISGDLPILLLRMSDTAQIALVRQLIQAHTYWRGKGLAVDLVIWNEDQTGYRQTLHEQIMGVISSVAEASLLDKPGGIFVRRTDQMSEEDKTLIQTVARVIISDTAGTLAEQMERRPRADIPVPRFSRLQGRRPETPIGVEIERRDLVAFNGSGGFTHDGREYVITTVPESPTPAPWVNVLANPWFGTVISESGGAYTWCENAHGYRLTPWNNDPVSDPSGEAFYIRDEDSGRFWSPTPLPARGPMPYTTRHGFGYTIFGYSEGGVSSDMQTYVAIDAPVKFIVLKLHNNSGKSRRLSVTGFFELVLGTQRAANIPHIVTEVDPKTGALFARNAYNNEFGDRVAFLDASETQRTMSGDRAEFIGRNGTAASPASMSRSRLSGRVGAALDPCMAMQVTIDLADGQEREIVFTLGSGRDLADARSLVNRFRGTGPARTALEAVWNYWNRTLGAVYVQTPDPSINFLTNGWLLYQVLASRICARSGFYQSGGAFGFRDQLQDSMALIHADPATLREQLLRCAAHQFREGDVQHWWHPPVGRGVRTRISDDYLWLPHAVCRYVNTLGDTGVLDERINFIEGRAVKPDEESYYDLPTRSDDIGTLYEHCVRSIRNGLRFGEHGLPLMGAGDWNDGMNLVGEHGKGESVWLAFFLYDVLTQFSELARRRSDVAFADLCNSEAIKLQRNIEQHAWDGEWYRRAYFDSGEPLGSSTNPECKIDSLPQSWSVLSRASDKTRAAQSLDAVDDHLVKRDLGVIQLFDPPFDQSHLNPGYIKGYVPGVRENGGQYTHAAVWAVMAFAAAGDSQRAWELFNLINPINHGNTEKAIARYKVEPYVIAADVYTNPQHAGRGGWTWYTGSAGWMYRLITESLLGLRLEVDRLRIEPLFPKEWQAFDIHYRYRNTFHHIHVRNLGHGSAVTRVVCDGAEQLAKTIPLSDDGRDHNADVEVGGPGTGN